MSRLPVIVGFGGINAAGRSSFHAGYRRLVIDKLATNEKRETVLSLATMMNLARYESGQFITAEGEVVSEAELLHRVESSVLEGTLIRKISDGIYPANKPAPVGAAGQLPSGFQPGKIYPSRHHPRALQMSVFAASDCIKSTGIPWEIVRNHLSPDQIAVYATSSMGQLDDDGLGGMLKAPSIGKRTTSKQCPLGFPQMVADFVNAYVLGSVGATGGTLGACATFLYNLEHAVRDIQSGARRFVLVGAAEAPVVHEVMEGYRAMGALAEDEYT
ncbi:MAG TPA: beta-ketoacyl synthase N-terminal-like domain-containing protein, partial [Pseudomonadales bacterium]|nr:beta-ketoacyl synthase N-terminal-like domain-containing protein [Pseudomonadales bacterium]